MLLLPVMSFVFNFRLSFPGHRSTSKNQTANMAIVKLRSHLMLLSKTLRTICLKFRNDFECDTFESKDLRAPVLARYNFGSYNLMHIIRIFSLTFNITIVYANFFNTHNYIVYFLLYVEIFYSCLVASPFAVSPLRFSYTILHSNSYTEFNTGIFLAIKH